MAGNFPGAINITETLNAVHAQQFYNNFYSEKAWFTEHCPSIAVRLPQCKNRTFRHKFSPYSCCLFNPRYKCYRLCSSLISMQKYKWFVTSELCKTTTYSKILFALKSKLCAVFRSFWALQLCQRVQTINRSYFSRYNNNKDMVLLEREYLIFCQNTRKF